MTYSLGFDARALKEWRELRQVCIGERRWGGAIISASIVAKDKA